MANFKDVAQLDTDNYFQGIISIQESPLEPGVYLYPPYTVDSLPDQAYSTGYSIQWDTDHYIYTPLEEPASTTEPELTPIQELAKWKAIKMDEVIDKANTIIAIYTYDYSEPEKLSWPKQEAEATQLVADIDAPAPLLRSLSSTRGVSLIELRDKILNNVDEYTFLSGIIIGTQQLYLDLIEGCTVDDIEELKILKIEYPI